MENNKEFLKIKDLSVCYHAYDDVVSAVNHINLSLEKGEREIAGKTISPSGLYLNKVFY